MDDVEKKLASKLGRMGELVPAEERQFFQLVAKWLTDIDKRLRVLEEERDYGRY